MAKWLVRLIRFSFHYSPVGIDANTPMMMKEIAHIVIRYPFFGSCEIVACRGREGIVFGTHC
ncbi:hypothetical protein MWN63_15365 [Paradonghicola geojensis]|nr:hypothetical protein [Marivivens geojensis]